MPFPKDLKIQRVEGELAVALSKSYPHHTRGFVKIGKKEWFLPYKCAEQGDKAYNFETRSDDTWIITYPRSGTTLTQELVWLVANDLNFDVAHRRTLMERFPFLEYIISIHKKIIEINFTFIYLISNFIIDKSKFYSRYDLDKIFA
ncbi:hypothetical protein ACFW04_009252 [Cataglyphis niger]